MMTDEVKYQWYPYDALYARVFEIERQRLKTIFDNVAIEHVGSTAVPGLGGKPVVDLVLGMDDSALDTYQDAIESIGYAFRAQASTADRLFFRKDDVYEGRVLRIHLHVVEKGKQDWKEMTEVRDYLRAHPEGAEQYRNIKKEAVLYAKGDGKRYREYKADFIKKMIDMLS